MEELQVTDFVRFCVVLSEYVPTAVNCAVVPSAMPGSVVVTAMLVRVALVTVNVLEPETSPDVAVIVLLLTPILVPVVTRLGIDPVHFGLVMMTCVTLGGMTPPVGVAMFTVCGMLKCPMDEYAKEALPLIGAVIVLVVLMIFVPDIVLLLPRLAFR